MTFEEKTKDMKKCRNCDIHVAGEADRCPLCGGSLSGTGTASIWPKPGRLRRTTFIYRLQLFVMLAIAVFFLIDDLILHDPTEKKYISIPIALWIIVFELMLKSFIRWFSIPAKIINLSGLVIAILLCGTAWYMGFLRVCLTECIPAAIAVLLIINFIFALFDTTDNAMVYLLCNILAGLGPYIVMLLIKGRGYASFAWTVSMLLSVFTFIGIAVFKGREMWEEVQKRMHI